jgi:LysR family transcriptional regulator, hydrogen peroxide-inducible genes activator
MEAIANEVGKIDDILETQSGKKATGELIVGVIPTLSAYLLPRLLPKLEDMFPELRLNIQELQTSRIVEALEDDKIDVGILATPTKAPGLFEFGLYYEPFSVLCRRDHELNTSKRLKYANLKFDDIWLLEEGHCMRHQVLDICSLRERNLEKRKFKFESGNLETLKGLVESYGGYTLLPAMAVENISSKTAVIQFERPIPAREIGLTYRREHFKIDLIEALGEAIVACIPESLRKIRQRDLDVLPI